MTDRPFFSIVIPTRNRGHLLRCALRSALDQSFDDFEVLISDNCSTDTTAAVIAEFDSAKLRVVGPDTSLSMPDHWEFALQFSRGEYVTYLCDDDALAPDCLEQTAAAIRETAATLLAAPYVAYYAPTWRDPRRRNVLLTHRFGGGLRVLDSRESLQGIYRCRSTFWTPRMLNSFARRDLLDEAHQKTGRLFWQSPDYSFAVTILTVAASWLLIEKPLRVYGVVNEATGATTSYNRDSAILGEYVKEFGGLDLLQRVPIHRPLVVNYIVDTLLSAKEKLGASMAGMDIDRREYFLENWRDMGLLEAHGVDVSEDRRAFHEVLEGESHEFRKRVAAGIVRYRLGRIRSRLLPSNGWLGRRAWQLGLIDSVFLQGEQWGFLDIVECARWISQAPSLGLR